MSVRGVTCCLKYRGLANFCSGKIRCSNLQSLTKVTNTNVCITRPVNKNGNCLFFTVKGCINDAGKPFVAR